MNNRKLTLTALLIATNVVLSSIIIIPLGPSKQHLFNISSMCYAVFVGPWYGLAQALISSIIRNLFGTGSFLHFLEV